MGAGYVSAWQAALMPSASKLSRCVFSLFGYPLRQGMENVGVQRVRFAAPDRIVKPYKNDTARHRFNVTFIPVSDRHFLTASIRINNPRVAAIRATEQVLSVKIMGDIASGHKRLFSGTAQQAEQSDLRGLRAYPQRVVSTGAADYRVR